MPSFIKYIHNSTKKLKVSQSLEELCSEIRIANVLEKGRKGKGGCQDVRPRTQKGGANACQSYGVHFVKKYFEKWNS